MLRAINAWRAKRRSRRNYQAVSVFDEQLLIDLGLTLEDVREARANRAETSSEAAVFP